jgi:DNA gyrase/topoisomerase IV subunit B
VWFCRHALDEKEREAYVKRLLNSGGRATIDIQGLGERNPLQLWSTTLDPEMLTILHVTVEDLVLANDTFERLIGMMLNLAHSSFWRCEICEQFGYLSGWLDRSQRYSHFGFGFTR